MREYESRCVDRSVDALVQSAGTAVAFQALEMLGSCYGTRVAVLAGPGLNGADGRVAGAWLKYREPTSTSSKCRRNRPFFEVSTW